MEKKSYTDNKNNERTGAEKSPENISRFMKDKRPRIRRSEQGSNRPDSENGERRSQRFNSSGDRPRNSFNPNFDGNNRLRGQRSGERGTGDREKRTGDSNAGGLRRNFSGRKPYGKPNTRFGNKKNQNDRYPDGGYDSSYKPTRYPSYHAEESKEPVRLNKFISVSGVCSRREADELIAKGEITVNGIVVTELGTRVNPGDKVHHNGVELRGEKKVYIVMNKPKGFVTTVEDAHADKTVMDIIKNACKERVYPVGRLDKNSLGVLLITNDGDLTKKLTHPRHDKKKIYQVSLDRSISQEELQKLCDGVELEDGVAQADEVNYVGPTKKEIGIIIHSGRNRVVRRMFEALGFHVQKLDRVYFAGLTKKRLKRGAWRYLTANEVSMLKSGAYE
ncbi:MAG: pseudouridine synthase [Rikenellaceae bacterium]|nr:pseudouridine synthase [Rikenellaceae bacterium]